MRAVLRISIEMAAFSIENRTKKWPFQSKFVVKQMADAECSDIQSTNHHFFSFYTKTKDSSIENEDFSIIMKILQ